jgi:hypothetical protein
VFIEGTRCGDAVKGKGHSCGVEGEFIFVCLTCYLLYCTGKYCAVRGVVYCTVMLRSRDPNVRFCSELYMARSQQRNNAQQRTIVSFYNTA